VLFNYYYFCISVGQISTDDAQLPTVNDDTSTNDRYTPTTADISPPVDNDNGMLIVYWEQCF
jgi:hypothetical protein